MLAVRRCGAGVVGSPRFRLLPYVAAELGSGASHNAVAILFRWQRSTMWSYPAMLFLGLLAGIVAGNVAAHAAGIDALRTYLASLVLVVPALAGARLLYVVAHWPM
jgi:hypothetical protein